MKISLNWLRDFVNIPKDVDAHKLANLFTLRTAEIEHVQNQAADWDKIVAGKILEIKKHPDADKLNVTNVDVGAQTLQIVCGGTNLRENMFVAVALVGAHVLPHGAKEAVVMQKAKIRGVESNGMICAAIEIGVEHKHSASERTARARSEEKNLALPVLNEAELTNKQGDRPILDLSLHKPTPGQPLAELFDKNDTILTVDNKSLTHRPDLWGHYGIAREIAAITDEKFKALKPQVKYPAKGVEPKIEIKEPKLCPRFVAVVIENLKIEPSPAWMQNRLRTVGIRAINNIVDITNYVMAELGQPTHAFDMSDMSKIEGGIIIRKAQKNEILTTLDGKKRLLDTDTLVIADHKKALDIAGIMGGADSEISPHTTKILMTAANFNPSSVRKTSVRQGLRTEAVQRYEKSLDPHLAELAMDRICELILEICPTAKITSPKIDIKNFDDKKITMEINLARVFSKIGVEIPTKKVIDILTKLEFKPSESSKSRLKVEVPTFRATKDISMEDDLVEEIARMYGYENIPMQLPELPIKLPRPNTERTKKHFARQILAYGLGFNEVYNHSFYSMDDLHKSMLPEELHISVANPLSEDQSHLRVSLIPNVLENILDNLKNEPNFRIFEIGRTYEDLQEYFPKEEKKICAAIVRQKNFSAEIFYEAKGALEAFLKAFRVPGLEMKKAHALNPFAHPNKYASYALKKNEEEIARVFELHPIIAKNYALDAKIGIIEINFTKLAQADAKEIKYKPIPKFPGITIDISILVDKNREIGPLQQAIQNSDKQLIKSVKLFDIYEGVNLPPNKKALAFNIHFRSDDRTLTDEEAKKTEQKIADELQKLGAQMRA